MLGFENVKYWNIFEMNDKGIVGIYFNIYCNMWWTLLMWSGRYLTSTGLWLGHSGHLTLLCRIYEVSGSGRLELTLEPDSNLELLVLYRRAPAVGSSTAVTFGSAGLAGLSSTGVLP